MSAGSACVVPSFSEDAGLELPELIAALIEQADAMQVAVDE